MCLDAIDPKVVVSTLIRKAKKKCCQLQCASVKLKGIKDGRWKMERLTIAQSLNPAYTMLSEFNVAKLNSV